MRKRKRRDVADPLGGEEVRRGGNEQHKEMEVSGSVDRQENKHEEGASSSVLRKWGVQSPRKVDKSVSQTRTATSPPTTRTTSASSPTTSMTTIPCTCPPPSTNHATTLSRS